MDVKVHVCCQFYGSFTVEGVESIDEAEMLVKQNCGMNIQEICTGAIPQKVDYDFDMSPQEEILTSEETNLPPKEEVVISGKYNEYGYVNYANNKPIYVAGNSSGDNQTYFGSSDRTGEKLQLPANKIGLMPLERIKAHCETSIKDFVESNGFYANDYLKKFPADKYEFVQGEVVYRKALNPRKIAHQIGEKPIPFFP